MRSFASFAAVAALAITVKGDDCSAGSEEIGGNWYCQAVHAITYANFGSSGSYNQVTSMDSNSGTCSSTPQSYSGSLAPLNDEVSLHFRGPLQLKQLAFYSPGSSSSKAKRHNHKRHGHAQFHAKDKEVRELQDQNEEEKRGLGDWVVMTMDGKVVSWENKFTGAAATSAPAAAPTAVGNVAVAHPIASVAAAAASVVGGAASAVKSAVKASATAVSSSSSVGGAWTRSAYYNSESGTADGISFLNHNGGSGSGVFDYKFGNSLSYASADGQSGASSPQVLADTTLPSNTEVVVMTDNECSGNSCGYTRPGTVAMHGFGGSQKIFLAELAMPDDGTSGWNMNMPAYWLLNAQIPRTLQYGQAECSCWTTGCGEFDIMEVLDSGNTRCKSTLHGNIAGGDSDYIERPTGAPIKVALVMSDDTTTIKILPSSFEFGQSLSEDDFNQLSSSGSMLANALSSLFTLG